MTDQVKPASRSWRRFPRFSVRRLIVLVIVIGLGLGWIVRSTRIQREAVAAIERAGASVTYDSGWTENRLPLNREPWAPKWLVNMIGVDFFGHVVEVDLGYEVLAIRAMDGYLEFDPFTQLADLGPQSGQLAFGGRYLSLNRNWLPGDEQGEITGGHQKVASTRSRQH
jgi:hypothetical protein